MKKYIHNWDELSEEQQNRAREQFKGNPGLNTSVVHPAAKFFEEHGWVKIDRFIDKNMANLLYHHVQLEAARLNWFEENGIETNEDIEGTFSDTQAPGDFSKYGDPIFDTLLSLSLEQMETLTAKELVPTYSYHRLYTTGTELKRHKDRPSCEISTTLCLGYDVSNVDKNVYPNWNWPMGFKEKNGKEIFIKMEPGDMIIYRGCELEHWREPFWGKNHAQVFLHYNEKGGQYDIPYDGRPLLGMSGNYRSNDAVKKQDKKVEDKKVKIEDYPNNNVSENKVPTKVIY